MISVRSASRFDNAFLIECIKKSFVINDFSIDFDEFLEFASSFSIIDPKNDDQIFGLIKLYLNSKNPNQGIYIVNRANMDVGFFTQDEDESNSTIGATCWVHPRACKMSILGIVQASLIRGALIYKDWNYVELNTWNPLIVSLCQKFMPNALVNKLREEYYTIYCELSDVSEEHTKKLLDMYEVRDIDTSDYTFVFTRNPKK